MSNLLHKFTDKVTDSSEQQRRDNRAGVGQDNLGGNGRDSTTYGTTGAGNTHGSGRNNLGSAQSGGRSTMETAKDIIGAAGDRAVSDHQWSDREAAKYSTEPGMQQQGMQQGIQGGVNTRLPSGANTRSGRNQQGLDDEYEEATEGLGSQTGKTRRGI